MSQVELTKEEEYSLIMRRLGSGINALITSYVSNGNKGDEQTGLVAIRNLKLEMGIDATIKTFRTTMNDFLLNQEENKIVKIARLLILANRKRRPNDKKSFQEANDIIITAINELNIFNQKNNCEIFYPYEDLIKTDKPTTLIKLDETPSKKKSVKIGGKLSANDTILKDGKELTMINKVKEIDTIDSIPEDIKTESDVKKITISLLESKANTSVAYKDIVKIAIKYFNNPKQFIYELIWSYRKKHINKSLYNNIMYPYLLKYQFNTLESDRLFNINREKVAPDKEESVAQTTIKQTEIPPIDLRINNQPRKSAEARLYDMERELEKIKDRNVIMDELFDALHYLVNLIKEKLNYENR